jgi:spermidine synthase
MLNCSIKFTLLVITLLLIITLQNVTAKVVHSERSLYRNIIVEDKGDLRCLKFNVKTTKTRQSCLYKSQPQQLVFNYTKQLLTALLVNPQPARILIIGLGGGTMSNTLHQLFPHSYIDNVEIDQSVIKVARQYFGFLENSQIKTYSQDGRVFVKRALLKKQAYDWIILDAFNGDYIPEHLMTAEFLEEINTLLSPEGILTANTFSSSKLYGYESATYKKIFGDFYQVTNANNNNRIILAQKNGFTMANLIKDHQSMQSNRKLSKKLANIGVDSQSLYLNIKFTGEHQDWNDDSIILTDQFSPANLLNLESD